MSAEEPGTTTATPEAATLCCPGSGWSFLWSPWS